MAFEEGKLGERFIEIGHQIRSSVPGSFKGHRPTSAAGLARAGWETVLELMIAAVGDATFRPGMVAVVQTAGDLGNWQPHLHSMVSRGGWSAGGEWVPVPFVDERSAELLFRHKVMRLLQDEGLL